MSGALIRPPGTDHSYRSRPSVSRKRKCENHAAIDERKSVQETPAEDAPRAPVNLIAKHIRDRNPKQSRDDQHISEHRNEQPARFVAQKGCIEQWFRGQQAKNSKRAHGEKFVNETKGEDVNDRQRNEQRPPEG